MKEDPNTPFTKRGFTVTIFVNTLTETFIMEMFYQEIVHFLTLRTVKLDHGGEKNINFIQIWGSKAFGMI